MAYLDLREDYGGAPPVASTRIGALFDQLEWDVILLARRDGLGSLTAPGRLGRSMNWLLGGVRPGMLASSRLESLRRLAVLAWHRGYDVPAPAMKSFLDAGFSADQMAFLLASISSHSNRRPALPA